MNPLPTPNTKTEYDGGDDDGSTDDNGGDAVAENDGKPSSLPHLTYSTRTY